MPIEAEFAELDFGRIRQGCKGRRENFVVRIMLATDNVGNDIRKEGH